MAIGYMALREVTGTRYILPCASGNKYMRHMIASPRKPPSQGKGPAVFLLGQEKKQWHSSCPSCSYDEFARLVCFF